MLILAHRRLWTSAKSDRWKQEQASSKFSYSASSLVTVTYVSPCISLTLRLTVTWPRSDFLLRQSAGSENTTCIIYSEVNVMPQQNCAGVSSEEQHVECAHPCIHSHKHTHTRCVLTVHPAAARQRSGFIMLIGHMAAATNLINMEWPAQTAPGHPHWCGLPHTPCSACIHTAKNSPVTRDLDGGGGWGDAAEQIQKVTTGILDALTLMYQRLISCSANQKSSLLSHYSTLHQQLSSRNEVVSQNPVPVRTQMCPFDKSSQNWNRYKPWSHTRVSAHYYYSIQERKEGT